MCGPLTVIVSCRIFWFAGPDQRCWLDCFWSKCGRVWDEDGDPVAQQFIVEVGIHDKTAKYMSNIFFTMRISHDCFCNGQPGRWAFTGSVLLVCKYSHAIMHKRLRLRRTSFRQSCIPVRHYRPVAFWRLYFRSNTPSWNPWKNIRTGHVAVDDFGRQQ